MKKRIVILEHSGGRLANQLWNFMSIFAYAKERGYEILNHSFFDYYSLFRIPAPNLFIKILSISQIRNNKVVVLFRPYRHYIDTIKKLFPKKIIDSGIENQFYLPPTKSKNADQQKQITDFENNKTRTLYTRNWMFRNPVGIETYRKEIINYFRPTEVTENKICIFINNLRKKYRHVVGVHIRQGDYRISVAGKDFYEQPEVAEILQKYLEFKNLNNSEVVFILCSDGPIDKSAFGQLNTVMGLGGVDEDIFTLSACDCIIGSNSTFGAFASYYGNIPFIIFERPMIDWDYYQGKQGYFENKKDMTVHY